MIQLLKQKLFSIKFDPIHHLNTMVLIFAISILFFSAFLFFEYLYQPIFYQIETVFIVNPSLNYELLRKTSKKIERDQKELPQKLQETYPDPFD